EWRTERASHLAAGKRATGFRKIGAIAPVLPGAEEEHPHAAEPAGLMHGDHVRLLAPAGIDSLMRLHRREGGETVAVDGGALERERGGGFLHFRCQRILHRLALPGEESIRFAHQLAV